MKHQQAGYQSGYTLGGNFIAILHGTVILEETSTHLRFSNGGWITRATTKALNGALLELHKHDSLRVFIRGGVMFLDRGQAQIPFTHNISIPLDSI